MATAAAAALRSSTSLSGASWDTSCLDWEDRLLSGRSLVPDLPLFKAEVDRALRVFKRLKLPDVVGTPPMAEACGDWFFPIVAALFGSYDPVANVRHVQEFFELIPKGNSKSSNGGAVMVAALILNRRPRAEFVMVAPTKEVAGIAFDQGDGTIRLDAELNKLFHTQRHVKTITHRRTGATLKIKAADTDVITGGKQLGTFIDETHVFANRADAAAVFLELRGALGKRPDGFLFQATTQSKSPPAGIFAKELARARAVRDGKLKLPLIAITYELPERLSKDGGWKNEALWGLVNPNLGRSLQRDFLKRELMTAEEGGDAAALALFASQHFNVQIGTALAIDNWVGAQYWDNNLERVATLKELLERCEIATAGADGGGLDDLYGFAVIGREAETGRWLLYTHAWCHKGVLERRKEIAPRLLDFQADGDLTIVERIGDDVIAIADLLQQVRDAGKFPDEAAIGVDPVGIGALLDELGSRGFSTSTSDAAGMIDGVPQGWQLQGAIKTVERKLAGGELIHSGSRLMAWCVGNAKVEPRANGILITKQASGFAKIDPLMATFNAAALMAKNPQPSGRGIFELYKNAASDSARASRSTSGAKASAATIKLRAPPGTSNVYGITGRQYLVGADGVVMVDEMDAEPLIAQGFARI